MEKQIYTAPAVAIVALTHQTQLLAGSLDITTSEEAADKDTEVLSRRQCSTSLWDER